MRSSRPFAPVALTAAVLAVLAGCSADSDSSSSDPTGEAPTAEAPADADSADADSATGEACEFVPSSGSPAREVDAPPAEPGVSGTVPTTIRTDAGDVSITLDAERAPCAVGSFLSLAEQDYFDDTQCHRLTTEGIFVLQCGDPSGTGRGGPGYSFEDELDGSETYPAGTLAMANAGPDTNGSQFFLVYADSQLPPSYTVFGQLDEPGLDVVQEIADQGVVGGAGDGEPAEPVTIEEVSAG